VLFVALSLVHPGYENGMLEDPTGKRVLMAMAALIVIGGFLIRKIVNIKV